MIFVKNKSFILLSETECFFLSTILYIFIFYLILEEKSLQCGRYKLRFQKFSKRKKFQRFSRDFPEFLEFFFFWKISGIVIYTAHTESLRFFNFEWIKNFMKFLNIFVCFFQKFIFLYFFIVFS